MIGEEKDGIIGNDFGLAIDSLEKALKAPENSEVLKEIEEEYGDISDEWDSSRIHRQ